MNARVRSTLCRRTAFAAICALNTYSSAHAQLALQEYSAEYKATYKNRSVGTSTFSLTRDDTGRYVFVSDTRAKGLLRMVAPNAAIDRSEFSVNGDKIIPQAFLHEDGSRKGDDNHSIAFDWSTGQAVVTDANGRHTIALESGMLDRGCLQVALMYDLSRGVEPTSYTIVDEDSATTYQYVFEGRKTIVSALGEIEVVTYVQERAGSSRRTIIDFAPSLGYVPVRIEQVRDGESLSAFVIETLTHT
jgi:hypothetical protein